MALQCTANLNSVHYKKRSQVHLVEGHADKGGREDLGVHLTARPLDRHSLFRKK
jgi:hypothetical protein